MTLTNRIRRRIYRGQAHVAAWLLEAAGDHQSARRIRALLKLDEIFERAYR